jgi:GTP-binding protein
VSRWQFELTCTAFNRSQLPQPDAPEVVFVGRSNVGKSTLINALLDRTSKKIAHVSSTPGKTRSLNFYRVTADSPSRRAFCLVDLPGYGYAARGRDEREGWWRLIDQYFGDGRRILFVVHLIDFRHGPLQADEELTGWLDRLDMPRLVVFTKGDKLPRGRAKSAYKKYVSDGLASLAPPLVTCGKNDDEAGRLREVIERAVGDLQGMEESH